MRVLVTGSRGFVGSNLIAHLRHSADIEILEHHRELGESVLTDSARSADVVIHLAGVSRPKTSSDFHVGNVGFTAQLLDALRRTGRPIGVLYASSIHADTPSPYGASKREAELLIEGYAAECGASCFLYRLPSVFGKWARPNYNSAVATFCFNAVHGIPSTIHDPQATLRLVYIDDVCHDFLHAAQRVSGGAGGGLSVDCAVQPEFKTTVGEVASIIDDFARSRTSMLVGRVGGGLRRALFATFQSYLDPGDFSYPLQRHLDPRGAFAEFLRTPDSGQFSYFTVHPGATRGGHYHHTKCEKFLVLSGKLQFRFRNIRTGEAFALHVSGDDPRVVETVPGWVHDVTNNESSDAIVMLWANEVFDPAHPDTFAAQLSP